MSKPSPDPAHRCPPPPRGKDVKRLHVIKGGWSAGGHSFDDRMRCTRCRVTWESQQRRPTYCAKAA